MSTNTQQKGWNHRQREMMQNVKKKRKGDKKKKKFQRRSRIVRDVSEEFHKLVSQETSGKESIKIGDRI